MFQNLLYAVSQHCEFNGRSCTNLIQHTTAQPGSNQLSNAKFLDLSDQLRAWKNEPGISCLFPRLFIFQRDRQQRFEIIALLPAAIAFLADPAVFRRDDVRTPEQAARISLAGLPVRAKTLRFGMLHVAIEKVFECFNDCFLAELRRCERCRKFVTLSVFRVADVYALQVLPLRLI